MNTFERLDVRLIALLFSMAYVTAAQVVPASSFGISWVSRACLTSLSARGKMQRGRFCSMSVTVLRWFRVKKGTNSCEATGTSLKGRSRHRSCWDAKSLRLPSC